MAVSDAANATPAAGGAGRGEGDEVEAMVRELLHQVRIARSNADTNGVVEFRDRILATVRALRAERDEARDGWRGAAKAAADAMSDAVHLRDRLASAERAAREAGDDAERLRNDVRVAGRVFRDYGDLHTQKNTPEGDAKASVNYEHAERCFAAARRAARPAAADGEPR